MDVTDQNSEAYWDNAERAMEACRRWERERDQARAELADARKILARLTDDAMVEKIARCVRERTWGVDAEFGRAIGRDALLTIRASVVE